MELEVIGSELPRHHQTPHHDERGQQAAALAREVEEESRGEDARAS